MKKTALATALAVSLGVGGMEGAGAAAIASFSITAGTFAMGFFTPNGPIAFTYVSGADLAAGYVAPTWNVNGSTGGPQAGSIMSFNFGGPYVNHYTAANAIGGVTVPSEIGGPVVNGTFGGGSITVDLSSLFANWGATSFALGNSAASGATTGGTSFNISWQRLIVGGPINGQIGTYTATGSVTAIPVPAAAWLMGSGLVGLAGVARRRR